MIYVTGDIHGTHDIRKLAPRRWPKGAQLTEADYLVILGDFGLIWNDSKRDRRWQQWLNDMPWTTLWIDGNHENHDLIDQLPAEKLFGGRVQRVPGAPKLIHLMRGEVYDIPDSPESTVRCFTMGGADSIDKWLRREGKSWWPREMPSEAEYNHARASLERVGFSVDYVFTHTCPANVMYFATMYSPFKTKNPQQDELTLFLQEVDDKLDKGRLKRWYFGHHHQDMICGDEQHVLLYKSIVQLGRTRP